MSKLNCPCGNQISDVQWPSVSVGYVITQTEYEAMEPVIHDFEIQNGRDVWECAECGRLAFEFPRGTNNVKWYLPENGEPGHILRPTEGKSESLK